MNVVRGPINFNDRSGAHSRAWGYVFTNQIEGDYYEFGVCEGDSLVATYRAYQSHYSWLSSEMSSHLEWRRQSASMFIDHKVGFHGFDTFEGMPANDENPIFSEGFYTADIELVMARCESSGLCPPQITLYKGLFRDLEDDFLKSQPNPAAIINLDCDLYAASVDALRICAPLIQDGTVLLADDYNAFRANPNQGQRRCMREFEREHRVTFEPWFSFNYNCQAFLCHVAGE